MFKQINNKKNQQIVKFKNTFYNINQTKQVIDILKNNIDKITSTSKQFLLNHIEQILVNNNMLVDISKNDNIKFYTQFLQSYDDYQYKYENIDYENAQLTVSQIDQKIILTVLFNNDNLNNSNPNIIFKKKIKEKNNLAISYYYKLQGNESLLISIIINDKVVKTQYIAQNQQFISIQQNVDLNEESHFQVKLKIQDYNNMGGILNIFNLKMEGVNDI